MWLGVCDRAVAVSTAQSGPVATIKDIRRSVLPDAVRVIIELDREVPFHDERIPDPLRVFVDLPGTRAVPALARSHDSLRARRRHRPPGSTGAASQQHHPWWCSTQPMSPLTPSIRCTTLFRIVIDCVRSTAVNTNGRRTPRPPTPQWLIARSLAPVWISRAAEAFARRDQAVDLPPTPRWSATRTRSRHPRRRRRRTTATTGRLAARDHVDAGPAAVRAARQEHERRLLDVASARPGRLADRDRCRPRRARSGRQREGRRAKRNWCWTSRCDSRSCCRRRRASR